VNEAIVQILKVNKEESKGDNWSYEQSEENDKYSGRNDLNVGKKSKNNVPKSLLYGSVWNNIELKFSPMIMNRNLSPSKQQNHPAVAAPATPHKGMTCGGYAAHFDTLNPSDQRRIKKVLNTLQSMI